MKIRIAFIVFAGILSLSPMSYSAETQEQEVCSNKKECDLPAMFYEKYFTFKQAKGTEISFDLDRDIRRNIFMKTLTFSGSGNYFVPHIYVKYYKEDNREFKKYEDYLEANSKDIFNIPDNNLLSFEPLVQTKVNKRKAYVIVRKKYRFKDYHSKTSAGAWEKEKIYVIPAEKGFYVLHYSAEESEYSKHIKAFEKLVKSFKGKISN